MYITVTQKFIISLSLAILWLLICFWISKPWINELAGYVTTIPAYIIVFSIALCPGFMYSFLLFSYLLDTRRPPKPLEYYPPISILIAAYNEENAIKNGLASLTRSEYPGELEIILIDDGSTDNTIRDAESMNMPNLKIINAPHGGKSNALNLGLEVAKNELIVTLDADTVLLKEALTEIVKKLYSHKDNVAVAGSIYVKNSRATIMTRIQEWDFFHSIAVMKRTQSLYQGTLVAQGAFSIYLKSKLIEVGGWPDTVGEDIVLTWGLLSKGYKVDFAEDGICFTDVPTTYKQFFFQRSRWARGLIEAFRYHPGILLRPNLSSFYVYWNLGLILFDSVFFFVFIPGLILALFGYYFIAGPLTLLVLPLGIINNVIFFVGQKKEFISSGLRVRKNILGLILFVLFFQFLMNPAVIYGYISELLKSKKRWGTK